MKKGPFYIFIVTTLVAFLLCDCSSQKSSAQSPSKKYEAFTPGSNAYAAMQMDIMRYVNEYRKKKGLSQLVYNDTVSKIVLQHSVDMADKKAAFGHDGFDDRLNQVEKVFGRVHASAENVAYGMITAKQVVDLWIQSPPHRKNLEGDFDIMGIAIAPSPDGYLYFTQFFVKK